MLGNAIMALVILTDKRPYEAIGVILRRIGFIVVPLSVLFIKYYPELGRTYHMGLPMFTGVAFQKNSLGQLCLITGIYFCWSLFCRKWDESGKQLHLSIYLIILPMTVWLFHIADSATALACMALTICILIISRSRFMARNPQRLITFGVVIISTLGLGELMFGIKDMIITLLGREPDLTDRVPIWNELLKINQDPIFGVGYESFWLGERLNYIWERTGTHIRQSHNGYLDLYLNIGAIGLFLLIMSIIVGGIKAIKHLNYEYDNAILRTIFIITVVIYNWTEASFQPLNNLFVLLLFSIFQVSSKKTKNMKNK